MQQPGGPGGSERGGVLPAGEIDLGTRKVVQHRLDGLHRTAHLLALVTQPPQQHGTLEDLPETLGEGPQDVPVEGGHLLGLVVRVQETDHPAGRHERRRDVGTQLGGVQERAVDPPVVRAVGDQRRFTPPHHLALE